MSVLNGIPTVDEIGDEALTNSIIDRSITKIYDNVTAEIGDWAFYLCSELTTVDFPAATSFGAGAFYLCSELTTVDFPAATSFGAGAFIRCTKLTTVILRNTEIVCRLGNDYVFSNTPIASGTGYIYVPKALVDSYKTATHWSTFANQIRAIEDYPLICDPLTWPNVLSAIEAGTYKDYYKVGDCIPLDLGSEEVINMQIAAFDADDLADGSGKAPITWIAKELLSSPIALSNTGNWDEFCVRAYLKETIKPMIPEMINSHIVSVTKKSATYDGSTGSYGTITTNDDVWVPSAYEMGADAQLAQRYEYEYGRKYDVITNPNYYGTLIKNQYIIRSNMRGNAAASVDVYGRYGANSVDVGSEVYVRLCFCT